MCTHTLGQTVSKIVIAGTLPAGLEPATLRLTAARSSQLSYGRRVDHAMNVIYI